MALAHYDKLETRSPKAREKALLAALPGLIAHAKRKAPGFARILKDVTPRQVRTREALAELPVTRKSDLGTLQRGLPPFGGLNALPAEKLGKMRFVDEQYIAMSLSSFCTAVSGRWHCDGGCPPSWPPRVHPASAGPTTTRHRARAEIGCRQYLAHEAEDAAHHGVAADRGDRAEQSHGAEDVEEFAPSGKGRDGAVPLVNCRCGR